MENILILNFFQLIKHNLVSYTLESEITKTPMILLIKNLITISNKFNPRLRLGNRIYLNENAFHIRSYDCNLFCA